MHLRASLIVAARNEEAYITNLLDSMHEQDVEPGTFEIIVVDGISDDETVSKVRRWGDDNGWQVPTKETSQRASRALTLLSNPDQTTPHAFNRGVEAASAEVVIIVGAHSKLSPDFVRRCLLALDETGAAVVGGQLEIVTTDPAAFPLARAQQSALATGGASYRTTGASERIEVDTVPFPAFRKSLWQQLGGFDEELIRNQDDEFILRVRQSGGRVVLCPAILSTYFARPTITRLRRQYYEYGLYRIATMRKRGRAGSLRPFAPLALLPILGLSTWIACRWRAILTPLPIVAYASILVAEGCRLNGPRPIAALRTATAIATMHLAYASGEWVGIARLVRGECASLRTRR